MGTQWFGGQRGLTLQRTLIGHSAGQESTGTGVAPCMERPTPGRTTRRMRDEMPREAEDSILFLKGIPLFYTIALPKDWRVPFKVRRQ